MAHDLATTPTSGLSVRLCGDAHIANFGVFASPERRLVFDLNDFDEAADGPFEWDVKRLAASIEVAGREKGMSGAQRRAVVVGAVTSYCEWMANYAEMTHLDVWYAKLDVAELMTLLEGGVRRRSEAGMRRATSKNHLKALGKLTHEVDGRRRIIDDPPIIQRLDRARTAGSPRAPPHRLSLVAHRRPPGAVRPVSLRRLRSQGGGRRQCRHPLLDRAVPRSQRRPAVPAGEGGERGRATTRARRSHPAAPRPTSGRRAAHAAGRRRRAARLGNRQRPRASSTSFVSCGTRRAASTSLRSGRNRSPCSRRCAAARSPAAHARTGDAVMLSGYLGTSARFPHAIADFASAYADQTERDHAALLAAIGSGRITAE